MAAGSIVVDLLVKTGSFGTDMKRAERSAKQFQKEMIGVGKAVAAASAVAATALAVMTKAAINNMDKLAKQAQMAGVTVESLSALSYAANLAGLSQDELTASMVKLTKGMSDAKQGTGEALKGFQALGIEVSKLGSADSAMEAIAEQFSQMQDGAEKTALAVSLFGRSGAQMIPFLNQGKDGLRAMAAEAEILGKVVGTETAKNAEIFNDSLTRMKSIQEGLTNAFAAQFLPVLNELTKAFNDAYIEAGGVKSEMGKLLVLEVTEWAENFAIALAHVVDAGVFVVRTMVAIGSSIGVILSDLGLMYEAVTLFRPSNMGKLFTPGESMFQSFNDQLKKRNETLASANKRYADLIDVNAALVTQTLQKAVANARLLRNIGDIAEAENFNLLAPTLTEIEEPGFDAKGSRVVGLPASKGGKGGAGNKDAERLQDILGSVLEINKEYAKSQEINLKTLATQDQMLALTNDQRRVQEAINDVSKDVADREQKLLELRDQAMNSGASQGVLSFITAQIDELKALEEQYKQLAKTQTESSIEAQRTFSFGWSQAFNQFVEDSSNQATKAGDMFNSLTSNMATAIDRFVETGKLSFGSFAASVIKDLIKIELQARASKVLGAVIGAIGSAFSGGFGTGRSFGNQDYGQFLADGGYTGPGAKYEPAGIVHKGEVVFSQEDVKRNGGVSRVEQMRLRGYANGGYVGAAPPPMGGGAGVVINIKNEAGADGYQATATAKSNDGGMNIDIMVRKALSTDLRNNGPMTQQIGSTFGLRRTA
jgi:lambda family phage tail tape measure protein